MTLTGLVDSHCHLDRLDLSPYGGSIDGALDAATAEGVDTLLCINVELERFAQVQQLAEAYPQVFASVGVHPLYQEAKEPTLDELISFARHPKVVAIGETGLDYFYAKEDNQWQRQRFITHIHAARATGLPLVVHTRDAKVDTIRLLREEGQQQVTGVMHCFTEDWEMAQQALDLGFYISMSGIVTFRNADKVREVARQVPLDRLLIETDAPWLAPVPYRGKQNEPKYIKATAQVVADLQKLPVAELVAATRHNFFSLFSKAQMPS